MTVFPLFYLGPVTYYAALLQAENPVFDIHEHYYKQTYRNRADIYTANGKMSLVIPVIKNKGVKTALKDIKISYTENWQRQHRRAIVSAYNNSPYFLYLKDEFLPLYDKKYKFLLDFNLLAHNIIMKLLKTDLNIPFSKEYIYGKDIKDYRNVFAAKNMKEPNNTGIRYTQVFEEKHGFIPGLSIIDLLFNEGNAALSYL